ncbi:SHOCT domain-containing protein [Nocardiopsis changdeensis]|uniref:SHOCT domain-containing protein n=1 Tax=Nocardiopsis changdeensis TaxID=2831969 RepID=UPI003F476597
MNTATAAVTDLAGHPPWGDGPPPFAPLGALMFCLLLAAAALAAFVLIRRRGGGPPPWAAGPRPAPPEYEARRTLADRFARGDITVEEFMERASALNWNPGHDDTKK